MAVFLACLVLLLAFIGHSSATVCLCKDGVSTQLLQNDIDYACGNGADCTPILQGGSCFNPNTVKDHCNFAVNSFYQRKNQAPGTCDFTGTAMVSQTPPNAISGCVYPTSPGGGAGTTPTAPTSPSISPPTNPSISPPTNPSISPPTNPSLTPPTNPSISPPGSSTNPIFTPPGVFSPPPFGFGPSGSGIGNGVTSIRQGSSLLASLVMILAISGLIWFMD